MFHTHFKRTLIFLLIFVAKFQKIFTTRNYDIRITSVRHKFLRPEIVDKFEVILIPYQGRNAVHLETILRLPLKTFQLRIISRVIHTNKKLMNITVDGCNLITNTYNDRRFGKIITSGLSKGNSTLPHGCPIPAKKLFVMDRFDLDPEKFPPFMPDMNIVNTVNLITSNTLIVFVSVDISVVRK